MQGVFCVYMCTDVVEIHKRRNFYGTCQKLSIQFVLDGTKIGVFGTGAEVTKFKAPCEYARTTFYTQGLLSLPTFSK